VPLCCCELFLVWWACIDRKADSSGFLGQWTFIFGRGYMSQHDIFYFPPIEGRNVSPPTEAVIWASGR
jgi:hypothetical protein